MNLKWYEYYVDGQRYVSNSKQAILDIKFKDGNKLGKRKQKLLNKYLVKRTEENIERMYKKLGI